MWSRVSSTLLAISLILPGSMPAWAQREPVLPAVSAVPDAGDGDATTPVPAATLPPPAASSAQAASAVSPALPADAARAARAKPVVWQLQIDAPAPLDKLLRTYLDLARFQEESSKDQSLGIRRSELRRLVVSAPDQARGLLEAEGYFNAQITTRVSEDQPDQPDKPVVVSIQVEPGPHTVISKVQFVFEGELDNRLSNSDPLAQALLDKLERGWGLPGPGVSPGGLVRRQERGARPDAG